MTVLRILPVPACRARQAGTGQRGESANGQILYLELPRRYDWYHVSIHHFDNVEDYFVYPIRLIEALPEIAIPLLPGDPPVTLDLQAVFNRTYDAGPYRREIDYRQDVPLPPLAPAWQSWLQEVLA